jgi:hypothetical protein
MHGFCWCNLAVKPFDLILMIFHIFLFVQAKAIRFENFF